VHRGDLPHQKPAILLKFNNFSRDLFRFDSTGAGPEWLLSPRFEFVEKLKRITILCHDGHEAGKIAFLDTRTAKVFEIWKFQLESVEVECRHESLPEDHHWNGGVEEEILEYWRLEMINMSKLLFNPFHIYISNETIAQEKSQRKAHKSKQQNIFRRWWMQTKQAIGMDLNIPWRPSSTT
jgi:hypothetical protein